MFLFNSAASRVQGGLLVIPYKFRKHGQPQVGAFHRILEGADREILRSAFAHPSLKPPAGYLPYLEYKTCATHVPLLETPKEAFTQWRRPRRPCASNSYPVRSQDDALSFEDDAITLRMYGVRRQDYVRRSRDYMRRWQSPNIRCKDFAIRLQSSTVRRQDYAKR